MFFKISLAVLLLSVGFSSSVAAQGAADWEGLYAGGTIGYGAGQSEHCDDTCSGIPGLPQVDPSGVVGGITLGYNFAMAGNWVLGIEGDWSFSDMNGSSASTAAFGCGGVGDRCTTKIDSFATLRFRAGYAMGKSLLYGTAGIAMTKYTSAIGTPVLARSSSTEASAVFGFGLERAINPKWSVKGEALYITDPGTIRYAPAFCAPPGCGTRDNQYYVLRLGANYRF